MKTNKIIKIITIILLICIISAASIFGIYKLKDYRVTNVVPDYLLGMEFSKSRVIDLKVDDEIESTKIYDKDGNEVIEQEEGVEYTEENGYTTVENKVNPDNVLTTENYKIVKSILEDRLVKLGAEQYTIKQDMNNGNIQIQIPENDNTDEIIDNFIQKGTFEVVDEETGEVLLNDNNIKSTNVVYGQTGTGTGTTVYLQIQFDKEGRKKLEEISQVYIQTTTQKDENEENTNDNAEESEETSTEDTENEETTQTKNVSIKFNGEVYTTTYFGDKLTDGILNISMGTSQDTSSLQQYITSAKEKAIVLDSGILPIQYTKTNYTLNNETNLLNNKIIICLIILIVIIISIYFIIKLKIKGILAVILQIGYITLLLLAIRYTNVKITIEGIVGILLSMLLNCIYTYNSFKNSEQNFIRGITAKFAIKIVPFYIIAIIFTFNSIANISSLGMTLVWGIIIMYLYNLTLTQIAVKTIEEK